MEREIVGRFRSALKAFSMRFSRTPAWSLYVGGATSATQVSIEKLPDSSVVVAPALWIARTFPEAPLVVEQEVGEDFEVVAGHPLTTLLRRPNPYWSGELMWMATILELYWTGNAYWIKVRNNSEGVEELWWVPTSIMEPKWPSEGETYISHYAYKPGGETVRVHPDDVVHFRYGIDRKNPRLGLSPFASVLREVFTDEEAALFSSAILKNMGVPGIMIAPDGDAVIDPDDLDATEERILTKFSGENRGKPFIAGAPTKVQQFGFSPKELDLRDLRRVPEERVTAVSGVPAIVAGLGAGLDRSTFANMKEAREMGYETTIIPLQRIVSADLANQILGDFEPNPDSFRIAFDLTNVRVLQEDENSKTERKLKELNAGAITLAEYRRETGREVDATHEVYLRPFNLVEVPTSGLGLQPSSTEVPAPVDNSKARTKAKEAYQVEINSRMLRSLEILGGAFSDVLEAKFVALGEQVAAAFEASPFDLPAAKSMLKVGEDPALVELARDLSLLARVDAFGKEALDPEFRLHYERVIADVETIASEFDISTGLSDPAAQNIIATGGTRAGLVDIGAGTRGAIYRALSDARAAGEGAEGVARRIRAQVPAGRFVNAGPKYRSLLIARTETKYAQNLSSIEIYKESPNVRGLIAFDAQGADSDPDCISRDGTEFSFADAERELASEHPNGTLSFAPVVS